MNTKAQGQRRSRATLGRQQYIRRLRRRRYTKFCRLVPTLRVAAPIERTAPQHQFEHTDRQIDALVYQLYGLSEREIAPVEGSTN